jgi:hypothetical protein
MTSPVGPILPGSELAMPCTSPTARCAAFAGHGSHHPGLEQDTLSLSGPYGEAKPPGLFGKIASALFGFFGARYAAGKLGMQNGWKKTAASVAGGVGASSLFSRFSAPANGPIPPGE